MRISSRTVRIALLLTVLVILAGCVTAPGSDIGDTDVGDVEYEVYDSEDWEYTHENVTIEEDGSVNILDLGTRTQDGSMHVYLRTTASDATYTLDVTDVELESREGDDGEEVGIAIEGEAVSTADDDEYGAAVIVYPEAHIEFADSDQSEFDYVRAELTDSWGETHELEREACGCVLETDPKSEE